MENLERDLCATVDVFLYIYITLLIVFINYFEDIKQPFRNFKLNYGPHYKSWIWQLYEKVKIQLVNWQLPRHTPRVNLKFMDNHDTDESILRSVEFNTEIRFTYFQFKLNGTIYFIQTTIKLLLTSWCQRLRLRRIISSTISL